jgi:type VII secretion integral membrane protein EccD
MVRFTRVTVVGSDGRRLDVSLPAQRPVVTLVPELCALLSLPPASRAAPWTLSTVRAGILDPQRSLDEAGIVDADVVFLAQPQEAPAPPYVDDVVDDLRAGVDRASTVRDGLEWAGAARAAGTCALAGLALALLPAVAVPAVTNGAAAALVLLLAGLLGTGLGWALRDRGGVFLAGGGLPAWTVGGWAAGEAWSDRTAVLAVTAALGLGAGLASWSLLGRRWDGVSAAGGTFGLLAVVGLAVLAAGAPADRAAAVVAVLVLVVVGLAARVAVGASGLMTLVRAEEQGAGVPRERLAEAARTGQLVLTGQVAGAAAAAAGAAATLVLAEGAAAPALGGVLAAACLLRSRAFTRTGQVLPLLAVGVVAAAAGAAALPVWAGLALLVATVLAVLALGLGRLDAVGAARLRRLAGLAEAVAVIATVPLALLVFDAVRAVRDLVS